MSSPVDIRRIEGMEFLEEHSRSLLERVRCADKETRDKLINICHSKIHVAVKQMRDQAEATFISNKAETVKSVAARKKSFERKNSEIVREFHPDDRTLGALDQITKEGLESYVKYLEESDHYLHRMDLAHADSAERHFRVCMGMYIERSAVNDDLHTNRVWGLICHMNKSLDLMLKMFCRSTSSEESVLIAQIDVAIEGQISELDNIVEKVLAQNIVSNDEIISSLIELPLFDGGEAFVH